MSDENIIKRRRTQWVGGVLLTTIPLVMQLRDTEMDPVNIIVIGGGLLWLWVTAVREDWARTHLNRIARNRLVRLIGGGLIVFATAWIARGAYIPPLTNPEAAENKYIRINQITPPDGKSKHAILIEFGVTRIPSEGLAIAVHHTGDHDEDWYGLPNKSHKQANDVDMLYDGKFSAENQVLRLNHTTFQLTPRKSYYLCIMSNTQIAEPNDILYFAVELNDRTTLSPTREKLGHQYKRIQ
jgi:hypothetical protein